MADKGTTDEEVVELNMPRPRSISRNPNDRTINAKIDDSGLIRDRRESDAVEMQRQSVMADDTALSNITRQVEQEAHAASNPAQGVSQPADDSDNKDIRALSEQYKRSGGRDELSRSDSATLSSALQFDTNNQNQGIPDADFRARLKAIRASDISEVLESIRLDPDSLIRQPSASAAQVAYEPLQQETIPQSTAGIYSNQYDRTREQDVTMADEQLTNPTHDQQYHLHQGSRGISPPPGFEDSAIPPYQDCSSDIPSYHNVVSQLPGISAQPSSLAGDSLNILPESARPAMTDKFMHAHIARHGASSLSPLTLLTPDQADTLPEYVLTGTAFDDSDVNRGRNRQGRFTINSEEAREIAKVEAELIAVRKIEEQEALEAMQAIQGFSDHIAFDPAQLAAIQASGDSPADYYTVNEMSQFQRLGSEPDENEIEPSPLPDDSELLQMMAQYIRRSPTLEDNTQQSAQAGEDELANMLRDRLLTQNAPSFPQVKQFRTTDVQTTDDDRLDTEVREILERVAHTDPVQPLDSVAHQSAFASEGSRSGVNVQALRDAAVERKHNDQVAADSQETQNGQTSAGYGGGHGVKRMNLDPQAYLELQERNAKKASAYVELSNSIDMSRKAGDVSKESFDMTTKLLMINPEYYTIWNYRREIMLNGLFVNADEVGKQELLNAELKRLQGIMRDYPKVYWIWNHRKWCLSQCPWPDWSRELLLVTKMLEQDARNFHVWEYRRYVISQIEQAEESSKAEKEFEYTTAAINSNFSNFSAWHNRTKLVPQILTTIEDNTEREAKRKELLQTELELIKGAIYTDPDDQSVWLYHKWLLNPDSAQSVLHPLAPSTSEEHVHHLSNELQMIDELMEEEPDNVWCTYAKVHYALSLQRLSEEPHSAEQAENLKQLMSVLEQSDVLREGRYRDWHSTTFSAPVEQKSNVSASDSSAFTIFSNLKSRPEWSDVALHGDGRITAIHASQPCTILNGWSAMQEFMSSGSKDKVVVANVIGDGSVEYSEVSKLQQ